MNMTNTVLISKDLLFKIASELEHTKDDAEYEYSEWCLSSDKDKVDELSFILEEIYTILNNPFTTEMLDG